LWHKIDYTRLKVLLKPERPQQPPRGVQSRETTTIALDKERNQKWANKQPCSILGTAMQATILKAASKTKTLTDDSYDGGGL
jgi:hypothetical protein